MAQIKLIACSLTNNASIINQCASPFVWEGIGRNPYSAISESDVLSNVFPDVFIFYFLF